MKTETTIDHKHGYVAVYVTLRDGKAALTEEVSEGVTTDYDAKGNLLGVEVIELWDPKEKE